MKPTLHTAEWTKAGICNGFVYIDPERKDFSVWVAKHRKPAQGVAREIP